MKNIASQLALFIAAFITTNMAIASEKGSSNLHLLLLSNTTNEGSAPLEHALTAINAWRGPVDTILFVPFAAIDRSEATEKIKKAFSKQGVRVETLTEGASGRKAIESAKAIYIGGGSTFRLLNTLQREGFLDLLRQRILKGLPYMGSSAGTNIVAPTIMTTNDMLIVVPKSMNALGIVPFQINPHYTDNEDPATHETREDRLLEYTWENETPVLGLRQGSWIAVNNGKIALGGAGARVFRHKDKHFDKSKPNENKPREYPPGTVFDFGLNPE